MTKKTTACQGSGQEAKSDLNLPVGDLRPAFQFIQLLGKDPQDTWFRTLTPVPEKGGSLPNVDRRGRDLREIDPCLHAENQKGAAIYFITGDAATATGKAVSDADITRCPAVFVEWDDRPIEWQLQAWQELGLPEPTAMVHTGGKSIHCYWRLTEPMAPEPWRVLQRRLIDYAGGDKACKNPSRLMRLPGYRYVDKATGKVTDNVTELIHQADVAYSAAEVEACLPAPAPLLKPAKAAPSLDWKPRNIDEINAAAAYIPRRDPGNGNYPSDRNALCGCSAALAEAGHPDPDGAALALLGHLWPTEAAARQVLDSTTTRNAASFWAIAAEHGYGLKRSPAKSTYSLGPSPGADPSRSEVEQRSWGELLDAMLLATVEGDDDELMRLRAEAITRFRRSDAQIDAALFKLHTHIEIGSSAANEPESLDLSRISGMDWLIEGFVPDNDLTLLWGNAGSGKTTAALAAASSVLMGTGLLDHNQPAPIGSVLFIASDSGAQPLYAAMQDMGMADLLEVQDGPQKRFHVWAADADQGMTAWSADLRGCIRLLEFIKRHRIRMVLIDSCKAVCSSAGLDYTNNQLVTALLTYFKEVICPHAAVVWLNHDGTAKGANAGAKAWKEIPSMVHSIIREENKDGSFVNSKRLWRVTKSRMGICREFYYELNQGELKLSPNQERVGNCLARVVDVLMGAMQLEGQASLTKAELTERICMTGGPSRKTLDNTLTTATRAKHPEVCRAGRGRYKLAPRIAEALKGCILNGKEEGQNPVVDSDLSSSRQVPMGSSGSSQKFPRENVGKLPNACQGKRSGHVPSRNACASIREIATDGLELVEVVRPAAPAPPTGSAWDTPADGDDPAWGPRPEVA
jgi:hypothetical protein